MAGKRWTQEELQILDEMRCSYTVAVIAKRLGRSFNSVNIKLNRTWRSGFEKSTDMLTQNQVRTMLGVTPRTVSKWQSKGLHSMRKGNYVTYRQEDLIRWLKNHPDEWNAAKVTDDSLLIGYSWYKEKRKRDVKPQYFWTPEEVSKLKFLRYQGYSIPEIARKMGRSESSIKFKLYPKRRKQHDISIGPEGQGV